MKTTVKNILKLAGAFAFAIGMGACQEEETITNQPLSAGLKLGNEVTAEQPLEAPANVVMINASKNAVSFEWSFPEGYLKHDLDSANNYAGLLPDTIYYELPGNYTVRVDAFGANGEKESAETTFEVKKPMPKLLMDKDAIEMEDSVTFSAKVFTYKGKEVTYKWDFGTDEIFTTPEVKMAWAEPGDEQIHLEVNDGVEVLNVTFDVEVKSELASNLYFFDYLTGKVFRKPLTVRTETDVISTPYSGANALDLEYSDGQIYVFDAGIGSYHLGSGSGGQIYTFDALTNGGYTIVSDILANNVPYSGMVDGNNVYYLDRREGLRILNRYSENMAEADLPDYFVRNNTFDEFYPSNAGHDPNNDPGGIGWGNMNGDADIEGDVIYWSKANNGQSIYTFSKDGKTAHDRLLDGVSVKTLDVYDGKIYFAVNVPTKGLKTGVYYCDLDGKNIVEIESYEESEFDQTGNQDGLSYSCLTGITGLVIDEVNEKIYWSYRAAENNPELSGVKRADLDGGNVELYISGYAPMGMAIDPTKR